MTLLGLEKKKSEYVEHELVLFYLYIQLYNRVHKKQIHY